MPVFFQFLAAVLGLAFVVVIGYALWYIAEDFEPTPLRPLGRFLKALIGGLLWAALGLLVAAGLFGVAIVIRAIFFRPVISFYIFQFWAIQLGVALICFYMLWGIYHGARNRLPLAFKYRR